MTNKGRALRKVISKAIKDGETEIIVREGQAEQIRENKIVSLSGTITAPSEFWRKREHEVKHAHVVYSKTNKRIELVVGEDSYFGKTITGVLKSNPELDEFKINVNVKRTVKELADFLKMRKFYFKDRDQATKIVTNLQKFKASVQSQIEDFDNTRGNSKQLFEVKTDSNMDLNFTLKLPVFKGQPDKTFKVEINFDVRDKNIEIWLESEEMRLIELTDIDSIFDKELKPFMDAKIVCIEQ